MPKKIVSVIVANHGRDLKPLIDSLMASNRGKIDLGIVDWGLERSVQRNAALKEAFGEIVLWLDSDQTVSPELIDECVELINMGYTSVYIPEIIVAKSFFGKVRAFERTFYTGTAIDVPRAILRKSFPKFDEEMNGPEDADMGNRIKGLRATARNPLYHHDDIGFFDYCRKKAYYTKSMTRYAEKNPNDPCLELKYRCWTVFTEKGKWKKIFEHPILSIGVMFLLIVRGYIYYANR
jgi:hypothetical protein